MLLWFLPESVIAGPYDENSIVFLLSVADFVVLLISVADFVVVLIDAAGIFVALVVAAIVAD